MKKLKSRKKMKLIFMMSSASVGKPNKKPSDKVPLKVVEKSQILA